MCYEAALARGYRVFGVQHGGWCAGTSAADTYKKYGKATNCANGRGGYWANDVYQITGEVFKDLLLTGERVRFILRDSEKPDDIDKSDFSFIARYVAVSR